MISLTAKPLYSLPYCIQMVSQQRLAMEHPAIVIDPVSLACHAGTILHLSLCVKVRSQLVIPIFDMFNALIWSESNNKQVCV